MALNKYSHQSDKIADLYRASFYLAKGSKDMALDFLKKSGEKFGEMKLDTKSSQLYWAEKILDRYLILK
jgi:hypothetical protein